MPATQSCAKVIGFEYNIGFDIEISRKYRYCIDFDGNFWIWEFRFRYWFRNNFKGNIDIDIGFEIASRAILILVLVSKSQHLSLWEHFLSIFWIFIKWNIGFDIGIVSKYRPKCGYYSFDIDIYIEMKHFGYWYWYRFRNSKNYNIDIGIGFEIGHLWYRYWYWFRNKCLSPENIDIEFKWTLSHSSGSRTHNLKGHKITIKPQATLPYGATCKREARENMISCVHLMVQLWPKCHWSIFDPV